MNPDDIRELTNHYLDTKLLNLKVRADGKGPYALNQKGYEPGSLTMETRSFLLTREGEWISARRWASLPDEEKKECFFESSKDALALMEDIAGDEVRANAKLPEGVSEEQAHRNYMDAGNRLVRRLREARAERERRAL